MVAQQVLDQAVEEQLPNMNHLIIFVKKPELGKVKTRLAKDIGEEAALEAYKMLLQHTRNIVNNLDCKITVYYNESILEQDIWNPLNKEVQSGGHLGKKMQDALSKELDHGANKVVIIGSDCLEISSSVIKEAFEQLNNNDVVIGPANDGGYYLLGLKTLHKELFENKKWSTDTVFIDTIEDITKLNLTHFCLKTLNDIDTKADLDRYELIKNK